MTYNRFRARKWVINAVISRVISDYKPVICSYDVKRVVVAEIEF